MDSYSSYDNYHHVVYKTINVAPATFERLRAYKVAGRSFDAVLNDLMDRTDPSEVHEDFLEEHRRRVAEMREGEYATLDELEDAEDLVEVVGRGPDAAE